MKAIGVVTIGKLIEAHYEKDEHKFNAYAEFIAEAYKERGEERAERIIRSKIDGSYKNKPVAVTLDKEIKKMSYRMYVYETETQSYNLCTWVGGHNYCSEVTGKVFYVGM